MVTLHDHNHNSRGKGSNTTRASKYIVEEPSSLDHPMNGGHVNLAYDGASVLSFDPPGIRPSPSRSPRSNNSSSHQSTSPKVNLSSSHFIHYSPRGTISSPCSDDKSPDLETNMYDRLRGSSEETQTSESSDSTPRLRLPGGQPLTLEHLMDICPFINEATLFEVTVIKNSRGLGLAMGGGIESEAPWAGLVRIKKIYPQTPAWLCGQLQIGDIILEANSNFLTGLTSHEALEVLRTTSCEVLLRVCRPPQATLGELVTSPGPRDPPVVTTSLTTPQSMRNHLSPSPSFSTCGEFQIELSKVKGSLGFTLRKQDNSILGHTIRSLVREPAISDGRMRSGDKILSVNGNDMCGVSHEEAVNILRTCPETVILRLYRDPMQTPVSPVSPTESEGSSSISRPKPLRHEARAMLTDIAFRKHSSPGSSHVSQSSTPGTPRRRRLQKTPSPDLKKSKKKESINDWDTLVKNAEAPLSDSTDDYRTLPLVHEASPFDNSRCEISPGATAVSYSDSVSSSRTDSSGHNSISENSSSSRPTRPNFLDLSGRQSCPRKSQFTPPHEMDQSFPSPIESPHKYQSVNSLDSAPQLTHSDSSAFGHLHQGYQSVNLGSLSTNHDDPRLTNTTSDHNLSIHTSTTTNEGGISGGELKSGLLKWKGVVFTPEEDEDDENSLDLRCEQYKLEESLQPFKPKIVTLEMNRGWNCRLGFSIQARDNKTVIVAIYADSVAAKDGRLKIGDQVLKVNNMDVSDWKTEDIIELLRKTSGKISISVLQQPF